MALVTSLDEVQTVAAELQRLAFENTFASSVQGKSSLAH